MATVSQTIFCETYFREWQILYFDFKISLKFIPKGPIYNNPAIRRQAIFWNNALTRFVDAYLRH